ncbi:MAG: hypothetical protein JHD16_00795 [Solirubrobacteraceae bacterium]|nr:hypothetical protein [Solirubrobacteraceae bacterium]
MTVTEVLPVVRPSAEVQRVLEHRTSSLVLSPARERGIELRPVGLTSLPDREVVVRTEHGTWLFADHVRDPTARRRLGWRRGRIPVPDEPLAQLHALHDAGVRPDLVWLGHELPGTWKEGDSVPVPTPRALRESDERLARRLRLTTRILARGAALTVAAGAALPAAALLPVAALGAGLDPIVLGGVCHPATPVVSWTLLAQWDWE